MWCFASKPRSGTAPAAGEDSRGDWVKGAAVKGSRRMNSTGTTAAAASPEPDQLGLRFFALVSGYRRVPPERALWRDLLKLALRDKPAFTVGRHTVSAADVHHVGLALYMRADAAGIVEGFAVPTLADDVRRSVRTVKAAVRALNLLRVFCSTRPSRRKAAVHRMNLGGLDWPAVRSRAQSAALVPSGPSGAQPAPLSGAQPAPPKGYTEELPLDPDVQEARTAAAGTDAREQQPRDLDPYNQCHRELTGNAPVQPGPVKLDFRRHRCPACKHSWPYTYRIAGTATIVTSGAICTLCNETCRCERCTLERPS